MPFSPNTKNIKFLEPYYCTFQSRLYIMFIYLYTHILLTCQFKIDSQNLYYMSISSQFHPRNLPHPELDFCKGTVRTHILPEITGYSFPFCQGAMRKGLFLKSWEDTSVVTSSPMHTCKSSCWWYYYRGSQFTRSVLPIVFLLMWKNFPIAHSSRGLGRTSVDPKWVRTSKRMLVWNKFRMLFS